VSKKNKTGHITEEDLDIVEPDEIYSSSSDPGYLSPDELDPFGEPLTKERKSLPVHLALIPRDMDTDALLAADPLTAYLAHLKYISPLSPEEQQALAIQYHETGNLEAAKKLILTNVRLVVKIAREYRRQRESLMELIQEGNVGLSEALQRYDPYRGVKFTSYAQYWIKAMIMNYLMNIAQPLKIGSTRAGRKLFYNLRKERERLFRETQSQPSTKLLAKNLDVDEEEILNVLRVIDSPTLSLDAPLSPNDKTPLGSILSKSDSESPEDAFLKADLANQVNEVLAEFGETLTNERKKKIWKERTLSENPASLQELGDTFGISRERVRQIEAQIKASVLMYIKERFGDEDLKLFFTE
jgi:RNA polymerase sigma-32 factor